MHTMYVDKPMRGHGLMQAIARVNRVFRDKNGSLVVDYIGIGERLKSALRDYSPSDREKTGIDEEAAVAAMLEKYEVVRAIFHGHDYSKGIHGTASERLTALADAIEWVLAWQKAQAEKAVTDEERRRAHRGYQDAVLALSKAFALASASDAARKIRDEVGFFQAVRAALVKTTAKGKLSAQARMFVVEQLINKAIANTEIVDILAAAGISRPNLSVLSDEFLLEVQKMERKPCVGSASQAAEWRDQEPYANKYRRDQKVFRTARSCCRALSRQCVVHRRGDPGADQAGARYARRRPARGGRRPNPEEIAFYDALADNKSAVEVMGDQKLRIIGTELLTALKTNVTVDWHNQVNARARMRTLVKRILRKYGYPPDLQESAVRTVIEQAERILSEIAPHS